MPSVMPRMSQTAAWRPPSQRPSGPRTLAHRHHGRHRRGLVEACVEDGVVLHPGRLGAIPPEETPHGREGRRPRLGGVVLPEDDPCNAVNLRQVGGTEVRVAEVAGGDQRQPQWGVPPTVDGPREEECQQTPVHGPGPVVPFQPLEVRRRHDVHPHHPGFLVVEQLVVPLGFEVGDVVAHEQGDAEAVGALPPRGAGGTHQGSLLEQRRGGHHLHRGPPQHGGAFNEPRPLGRGGEKEETRPRRPLVAPSGCGFHVWFFF